MLKSIGVNINPSANKKWLPEDFALKKNTIDLAKIIVMETDLGHTKFRIFHMPSVVAMLNHFIPIPIDHFLCRLRLDLTFCDLLTLIGALPAYIYANGVRYCMPPVILCR